MSELLDVLRNLPPVEEKKHYAIIEGKSVEVSLQKKKETIQHGEENFVLKGGEVVLKPKPKKKAQYPTLQKAEKGIVFQDNDIHWPTGIAEGGEIWKIK